MEITHLGQEPLAGNNSFRRSRNSTLECSAGLPLKDEAPAERSTKSEQLEWTKEAKGFAPRHEKKALFSMFSEPIDR